MEKGEYHYHQQVHYSPCGGGERDGIGRDNGEEKRPSGMVLILGGRTKQDNKRVPPNRGVNLRIETRRPATPTGGRFSTTLLSLCNDLGAANTAENGGRRWCKFNYFKTRFFFAPSTLQSS